eukprot:c43300_g1_i1 orf=98-346(+)
MPYSGIFDTTCKSLRPFQARMLLHRSFVEIQSKETLTTIKQDTVIAYTTCRLKYLVLRWQLRHNFALNGNSTHPLLCFERKF